MTFTKEDIRWKRRFTNYCNALTQHKKSIDKGDLSELEKQGLIKAFEYTNELAWNTLQDKLVTPNQLIFCEKDGAPIKGKS